VRVDMDERIADTGLGVERGHVRLVPYDRRWPQLFENLADILRSRLGDNVLAIDHVGSTAVPGLSAKPLLDVLVAVADLQRARSLEPVLARLGFEHRPDEGISDRHFYRRLVGNLRTHHLAVAEPTSRHWRETVVFRDALRRDERLRTDYERLKWDLAEKHPDDIEAYIRGKTAFVANAVEHARLRRI